ncbi:hypothetical protein TNCV_2843461 [Trichonephila clavipes]|nr:hypothetical protein TNCV_2843461 [Trichonephila clavipes]
MGSLEMLETGILPCSWAFFGNGLFLSNKMELYPTFIQICVPICIAGDEAHFWLNGYVNKQNCRIWSEANPQVNVETLLHPEKLTVWCALWAGGILLQKR